MRDLGVMVTAAIDFDVHITQVVKSATLVCNLIFRCFIIKTPDFYINLYKSLVIPKLLYCCEVWRPYLRKHTEAIDNVQKRFVRRVSRRCDVPRDSIDLRSITELFDAADISMYARICRNDDVDKFFRLRDNSLRSGVTITALEVAASERVNNLFAWRAARLLRR